MKRNTGILRFVAPGGRMANENATLLPTHRRFVTPPWASYPWFRCFEALEAARLSSVILVVVVVILSLLLER